MDFADLFIAKRRSDEMIAIVACFFLLFSYVQNYDFLRAIVILHVEARGACRGALSRRNSSREQINAVYVIVTFLDMVNLDDFYCGAHC